MRYKAAGLAIISMLRARSEMKMPTVHLLCENMANKSRQKGDPPQLRSEPRWSFWGWALHLDHLSHSLMACYKGPGKATVQKTIIQFSHRITNEVRNNVKEVEDYKSVTIHNSQREERVEVERKPFWMKW
jgi:hypothetical protein